MPAPLVALLAGGASAVILVPAVLPLLRWAQALDHPNERSSHRSPTPRGGGVAVVTAIVVAIAVTGDLASAPVRAVLVATVGLGVLGLVDDVVGGMPVWARLVVSAGVAAVAAAWATSGTDPVLGGAIVIVLGALWITGFTNSFNFMDGINGISGLHGAVAGGILAVAGWGAGVDIVAPLALAVAGASAGFLPYNLVRPKVFLGDVGSYGIGGALAAVALVAWAHGVPLEACLGSFVPYVADTSWTVLRRVRRGERFYVAHREHAYQRLCDAGLSHVRVASTVTLSSAATGFVGLASLSGSTPARAVAVGAAATVAVAYLRAPSQVAVR